MDASEKYSYWKDIAEYDLDTAAAMLNSGRYLYVVFMCQQAIEKLIKGLFVLHNEKEPPRTHNILTIFEKIHFKILKPDDPKLNEYKPLFEELLAFYISERYPLYKEKLSTVVDRYKAQEVHNKCKEAFEWLKSLE